LVVESFATNTVTPVCDTVVDVEDEAPWAVVVEVAPVEGTVGRATPGEWLPSCRIRTPSTTAVTITAIARPRTI
jgi:hypothetical protein